MVVTQTFLMATVLQHAQMETTTKLLPVKIVVQHVKHVRLQQQIVLLVMEQHPFCLIISAKVLVTQDTYHKIINVRNA